VSASPKQSLDFVYCNCDRYWWPGLKFYGVDFISFIFYRIKFFSELGRRKLLHLSLKHLVWRKLGGKLYCFFMHLVLMRLGNYHVGGEHGIEEEEDRFLWWLWLDWLHVLAVYSKCESHQQLEREGTDNLFTALYMKFKAIFKKLEIYINTSDPVILILHQKVISETLRMANIINGVWRKALKDVEIKGQFSREIFAISLCAIFQFYLGLLWWLAGYSIPQGWCVLASFISVHMDENNYENPNQFDPWRWEVSIK
jgi:hypothetical protein